MIDRKIALEHAVDEAERHLADDVVADGVGDLLAEVHEARALGCGHQLVDRALQAGSRCGEVDGEDQHDERAGEAGDERTDDRDDAAADLAADRADVEGRVPVLDVGPDLVHVERGEDGVQPVLDLADRVVEHAVLGQLLDGRDELSDLLHDDRHHHEDDAGEDGEHPEDRDEDGRPAGQLAAFEPRDDRIQAEREEQRGPDVEEDRLKVLDAADEEQSEADTQRCEQRGAERAVQLHLGPPADRRRVDPFCPPRIRMRSRPVRGMIPPTRLPGHAR